MDIEAKVLNVCDMMDLVMRDFHNAIGAGLGNVSGEEAFKAADILKDLAETEKLLRESHYYKLVAEAMEKPEDDNRYNMNYRQMSSDFYKPMIDQEPYVERYLNGEKPNEIGESYNEYKNAKRHYTETHSTNDKEMMSKSAENHLIKTVGTIKEMWMDADPTLRARMKSELSTLMTSLTQ